MNRRGADAIDRHLSEWERTRESLGADAPPAVVRYVDDEMARLHHERAMRDRPMLGGRRATDPR